MKQSTQGFSIIELLIGMFIFAIGLMAIYGLLVSSLRLNDLSKDSIIATNLAREALEIVRHTRDSNYEHMYLWNKLPGESVDNTFKTGTYYTVENNWNEVIPEEDIYKQIADFGQ